jgi:dihydroorotase
MIRLRGVRVLEEGGLGEPRDMDLPATGDAEIDSTGQVMSPGWCDLHAHLRDPGFPEKETLGTGAAAAAAGGFTDVVAMANTQPPTDEADRVRANLTRARDLPVRVAFVAALTRGLEGRQLTNATALKAAGAVALSDDGRNALDQPTLVEGLRRAAAAGLPVLLHAQDESLGTAPAAELAATRQALAALRRVPDAHLHLQHVSLADALPMIVEAKRDGLAVTAEVTPHHLWLTADAVREVGAQAKVNPPLRTERDVMALRGALIEGVIDVVATDHAPHEASAKQDLDSAAFGISGFETAAGVLLTLGLPWPVIHRTCVTMPRAIAGIAPSSDWVLLDPTEEWTVDPERFLSRGHNTPLGGTRLRGRVRLTVCRGRAVFRLELPVG